MVGMALSELGQPGLELWVAWSRSCEAKFSERVCYEKWATFRPHGGIGLGSLFYHAELQGWKKW
jgi:hypothetical protein